MIELIKFEFKKIITKKIVIILALVVIGAAIAVNKGYFNDKASDTLSLKYEESNYSFEDIKEKYMTIMKKYNKGEELSSEENFIRLEVMPYYPMYTKPIYNILDRMWDYEGIKEKINSLENEEKQGSYEYKVFKKAERMTRDQDEISYKHLKVWNDINNYSMIHWSILIMLLIGLIPIFSDDYSMGTAPIVLSTIEGKRNLIKAKIISGLLYGTIVFLLVIFLYLLNGITKGFYGGDLPLNYIYNGSPYNISILQGTLLGFGICYVGVISFSLLTMLFSLLLRNQMSALTIVGGIYILPSIISMLPLEKHIISNVQDLSFMTLFYGSNVLNSFRSFNILGNAIMKMEVVIGLATVVAIVSFILIMIFGNKQRMA